jgi:hypothetical protein
VAWRRCTLSVSRSTKSPWCTRSGMSISSPSSGYPVPVSALGTTVPFDGVCSSAAGHYWRNYSASLFAHRSSLDPRRVTR